MAEPANSRPIVPIPAADALFTDTLRAALALYVRGDYMRASELFKDASALSRSRPDARMWRFLGYCLDAYVVDGELVSRPLDDVSGLRRPA